MKAALHVMFCVACVTFWGVHMSADERDRAKESGRGDLKARLGEEAESARGSVSTFRGGTQGVCARVPSHCSLFFAFTVRVRPPAPS